MHTQNILQDRSHIRAQKRLNKFKKIEIISSIFSDHNGMKLETHYKNKTEKFTSMWRLNNILLSIQCIKVENKREVKNLGVSSNYCDNHFMIHIKQIIKLYALNK